MNNSDQLTELSIQELLSDTALYSIPVYQRNYAWGESQITQLIQDIIDSAIQNDDKSRKYYLGTLIIYEREKNGNIVYETIDGQQRLTTLSILSSVIKNEYKSVDLSWYKSLNLTFKSRDVSTTTMSYVFEGHFPASKIYNEKVKGAYSLTNKILKTKLEEYKLSVEKFSEFLFRNVKILRVPVPRDTDLNHYFEVMNNRGEQLEKHEILKAKMLEKFNVLDDEEKRSYSNAFNKIWEACSNMEKYVQYGFNTKERDAIFLEKDWNKLQPTNFDELALKLLIPENAHSENISYNVDEIINGNYKKVTEDEDEQSPDRFSSIINFPNFLLQVLRVSTSEDIPLDDKRLLDTFDLFLRDENSLEFVKSFGFDLLKMKFYYDKFIIKREFIAGTDRWSLKRLKWYEGNRVSYVNTWGGENDSKGETKKILMLLAMFHVSTPTLVYKHWLNAALLFLYNKDKVISNEYLNRMNQTARDFVYGRFLAKNPNDYYLMIYGERESLTWEKVDITKLTFGNITNNLVFNYLDFLLWYYRREEDSIINGFDFTARSSVEHYYPQNPIPGFEKLDENTLNSFGNLCLISHSKNSRLSNQDPIAKSNYYARNTIDSIKQHLMMKNYNPKFWNDITIANHNEEMIEVFKKELVKHE